MRRSNIVISSIALFIMGVVVLCLFAFKEKPKWQAAREEQRNVAAEERAVNEMMAFATRCSQVEELVLESSHNVRGETRVADSNRFTLMPQGEVQIDTLFENEGKKLTFRIEPKGARNVYYYLQLMLPAVKTITADNINLDAAFSRQQNLHFVLKGETGCDLFTPKYIPQLQVNLADLSSIQYEPSEASDKISITASGNALVKIPETIAKQLQQKSKLILRDNAIVR